jgi:hypothetical protein
LSFSAIACVTAARADADSERCYTHPEALVAIHQPADDVRAQYGDTEFGFQLTGNQPQVARVTVNALAGSQIYQVHYRNVAFATRVSTGENSSDPLYFSLASAAPVTAIWIDRMQIATDAPEIACVPAPDERLVGGRQSGYFGRPQVVAAIRSSAPVAGAPPAVPVGQADLGSCGVEYSNAYATHVVVPAWPMRSANFDYVASFGPPPWTVLVRIDLDGAGKVASESVEKSLNPSFDRAAMLAAKESTYEPARFLCIPIPASYIFHSEFSSPHP